MLGGNSISVTAILERLFRTSAFTKHMNLDDAIVLAAEAIDLIGAAQAMDEKITNGDKSNGFPPPIEIKGFKGKIPIDLKTIKQTRNFETKMPMRYATDTFHNGLHCSDSPDLIVLTNETYKIRPGGIIHTSFEEGYVEMAYFAYAVDEYGLPTIPDDERYVKGIESYIKESFYRPLWELGKISDKVYDKVCQERDWWMGSAHNYTLIDNIDKAINTKNMVIRLIPELYHSQTFFQALGEPEVRYNNGKHIVWNR